MSRIRTIKPEFFLDDQLAELPALARLLFIGLWTIADCAGRMEDRPKRIKAQILPFDNCDPEKLLQELHKARFILRYRVESEAYIQVVNFNKHQRLSGIEAQSVSHIPAPNEAEEQQRSTEEAIEKQCRSNEEAANVQEGKGKERSRGAIASRLPADWKPDEVSIAFCKAERPDLIPDRVADRFRDYWTAQPDANGRKTDWKATWRNWVRAERANQQAANVQPAIKPGQEHMTKLQRFMASKL